MATKTASVGQRVHLTGHRVAQLHGVGGAVPENPGDLSVPADVDVRVADNALGHDPRGAELVTAVHDRHLRGDPRQEQRLLHGRVAAADHDDLAVAEEEPVARGAGAHAEAAQPRLALEVRASGQMRLSR